MPTTNNTTQSHKEAIVLLQQGRLTDARQILTKICAADDRDVGAWFMLSAVSGQLGLYDEAISACRKVVAVQPDYPSAYVNMGNAFACMGQHDDAAASYQKALRLKPDDAVTLNNYGHSLFLAGRAKEALESLRRAVHCKPDYADAHYNLASVLDDQYQMDEAMLHYNEALRLKPELSVARLQFSKSLSEQGKLEEAAASYRQALTIWPDAVEFLEGLAMVMRYQGKLNEALAIYRDMAYRLPDNPQGLAGMADIHERMGNTDEAYACLQSLTTEGKKNATAVDVLLRLCQMHQCCDEAIALADDLLSGDTLRDNERQALHFALGRLHDKLGAFESAFEHFRKANEQYNFDYKAADYADHVDALIATYNKNAIVTLPRSVFRSDRPVFIVGMPRSGTSLAEKILASHPEVYGAGELDDINQMVVALPKLLGGKQGYPQCVQALHQHIVDEMAQQYLVRLDWFSMEAMRVIDKNPHNFHHLGLIALLFPEARVIHCRRDPIDTCLSIYFQTFNRAHPYAADLEQIGSRYQHYRRLMEHWTAVLDIPVLEVEYEELVTNTQGVSRSMVEFCGLEWDEACMYFHESDKIVATASYHQVRKPIYNTSIGRWKNYQQYLEPLQRSLG